MDPHFLSMFGKSKHNLNDTYDYIFIDELDNILKALKEHWMNEKVTIYNPSEDKAVIEGEITEIQYRLIDALAEFDFYVDRRFAPDGEYYTLLACQTGSLWLQYEFEFRYFFICKDVEIYV